MTPPIGLLPLLPSKLTRVVKVWVGANGATQTNAARIVADKRTLWAITLGSSRSRGLAATLKERRDQLRDAAGRAVGENESALLPDLRSLRIKNPRQNSTGFCRLR